MVRTKFYGALVGLALIVALWAWYWPPALWTAFVLLPLVAVDQSRARVRFGALSVGSLITARA